MKKINCTILVLLIASSYSNLFATGPEWPSDDDPTPNKTLARYYPVATKHFDPGDGTLPAIDWTCYLPYKNAGSGWHPTSRIRAWFVGYIDNHGQSMAGGVNLYALGARNRKDTVLIKVQYKTQYFPLQDADSSVGFSIQCYKKLANTYSDLVAVDGNYVKTHTEAKIWQDLGFKVIPPTNKAGIPDEDYILKINRSDCVLEVIILDCLPVELSVRKFPTKTTPASTKEVEDGGPPPGDPSDLN